MVTLTPTILFVYCILGKLELRDWFLVEGFVGTIQERIISELIINKTSTARVI